MFLGILPLIYTENTESTVPFADQIDAIKKGAKKWKNF